MSPAPLPRSAEFALPYSDTPNDEIYISTDVETDGPIPGPHSMLSLGSAAYSSDRKLIATFSANLETLPGAEGHPDTMAWWTTQPEAWAACRKDLQPPEQAMRDYLAWVKQLGGRSVFVAYPAGFDFTFVYWYLIKFTGYSPFSHSALDMKTLAMALLKKPYRESVKRNMPRRWFAAGKKHTHTALDDAIEQGALFCSMLEELEKGNA
ncbi:MAG: 3'-5' exoribonuclease [Bryobacteraceae bacterium]